MKTLLFSLFLLPSIVFAAAKDEDRLLYNVASGSEFLVPVGNEELIENLSIEWRVYEDDNNGNRHYFNCHFHINSRFDKAHAKKIGHAVYYAEKASFNSSYRHSSGHREQVWFDLNIADKKLPTMSLNCVSDTRPAGALKTLKDIHDLIGYKVFHKPRFIEPEDNPSILQGFQWHEKMKPLHDLRFVKEANKNVENGIFLVKGEPQYLRPPKGSRSCHTSLDRFPQKEDTYDITIPKGSTFVVISANQSYFHYPVPPNYWNLNISVRVPSINERLSIRCGLNYLENLEGVFEFLN